MYLVAVGGGQPKRMWHLLPFYFYTRRALRQARRAKGCVKAGLIAADGCYLSVSVWESPGDMKRYAASGAHAQALRASRWLVAWFRFHHFQSEEPPRMSQALAYWREKEAARDV
ncbi:antibiotic biosynthesis monooxygenase family protein [Sulfitobacter sabulilitoris]|uniref:DUF3291 domain-containing protein n=1 Tax=Sulfitobacter sabulilitoris TaxID=2562655 RepID=A0A5S3PLM4_9RHOB|nr:hypothetical protein [Sulfitobacter sabulilitoris]TMM55324.1 hypothetical protein FDT80_07160 [Sulfitobacter sabulilitoris]